MRLIFVLCALLGFVTATGGGLAPPVRAHIRRPNILVLVADDQALGSLRVRMDDGSRRLVMPNVTNRIQKPGIAFLRAYISNPLCCPSRTTILTGLYSKDSGVYTNPGNPPFGDLAGDRAFETNANATRTFSYYLNQQGYQTALFGKYLNGYQNYAEDRFGGPYRPPGWDVWHAFYGNNGAYYNYDVVRCDGGDAAVPRRCGRTEHYGEQGTDHSTRVFGNDVTRWLRNRATDRPFLAYFAPFAPHGPPRAEPRDIGRFSLARDLHSPALNESAAEKADMPRYVRSSNFTADQLAGEQIHRKEQFDTLFGFDRQIGRILDVLRERRELRNTIIVYLSDNGVMWGEHDLREKAAPYERSSHVPFFIRWDGIPGGYLTHRSNALAANVDIAPTIYGAIGFTPPTGVDGVDLLTSAPRPRNFIYLETIKYGKNRPSYCGLVTRSGWKYVVYVPTPGLIDAPFEDELYRVSRDPHELRNLADDTKNLLAQAKLEALRGKLQKVCTLPTATPAWFAAWAP